MFEKNLASGRNDDQNEYMPMFSLDEDYNDPSEIFEPELPLIALKNNVLFPGVVIPITVGRDKSIKALRKGEKGSQRILVVSQKEQTNEDPDIKDLYDIGVVAKVIKILKMPDGSITAILQGRQKIKVEKLQCLSSCICNSGIELPNPEECDATDDDSSTEAG